MDTIFNLINSVKRKNLYSVINTTLIANPYVTDFPKEYFEGKKRDWTIFQFLKSTSIFYLKTYIKLSIFTIQKMLFSIVWSKRPEIENTIIDTFLLSNRVLEHGKYEDSYFQGLYAVLEKRNIRYSYLLRIFGLKCNPLKFIKLLQVLKREKKSFIFEYQLVSYFDILKIYFHIFLYPFQTLTLLQKDKLLEKGNLFNFHLIEDISKQDLLAWTRYFVGRKLAQFPNIEKIISWSEFQVIERSFNFGYRTNGGSGKIFGSQLYISYPTYFNSFVFDIDYLHCSSPHRVLVNGKHYIRKSENNLYKLGVSLRYREVFQFRKDNRERKDILILAPYFRDEVENIVSLCEDIPTLKIKLHPTQQPNSFQFPKNISLVSGNLYDFFQTTKIVITTESGTAVEAVAVGVSVVIVASKTNLTSNPLIDYGKGEIWDIVSEKDEIVPTITKLSNFRKENPDRILEIAKYYKDNFFIEPTEENIMRAFELE